MITFNQAKKMALREKGMEGLTVVKAVEYRNFYVFSMQPEGVDPMSEEALLDSYVIVNYETGKIDYRSLFDFPDFEKEVKEVSL